MKTVSQKLQEAYDWYLQTWVETIYASEPMSYYDWIDVCYNRMAFGERFAPKDTEWAYSKLGSLQGDMKAAFEEHEKELHFERDNEVDTCANMVSNRLYVLAKRYVDAIINDDADEMNSAMRRAKIACNASKSYCMRDFQQYVRDLVMTTI